MYTATLIGDTKNTKLRRRLVNVEFTDGRITETKEFQFNIDEEVNNIKKRVKEYLDELNFVPPEITGDIADYVPPAEETDTRTPEEIAYDEYLLERESLAEIKRDLDLGLITAAEYKTESDKVKAKKVAKPVKIKNNVKTPKNK